MAANGNRCQARSDCFRKKAKDCSKIVGLSVIVSIVLIASLILGFFLFFNFSFLILREDFLSFLTGGIGVLMPSSSKLSSLELENLQSLINGGHVLTHDQLLEAVSAFYNNTINTLIVVISLLGVFAYLSIRSLSRRDAEDIAEVATDKVIDQKFSNSEYVVDVLNRSGQIRSLIEAHENLVDENEKRNSLYEDMEAKVKRVEQGLSAIEYWLMKNSDEGSDEVHLKEDKK